MYTQRQAAKLSGVAQATIDAVDNQTPADVQNAAKCADVGSEKRIHCRVVTWKNSATSFRPSDGSPNSSDRRAKKIRPLTAGRKELKRNE